MDARARVVAAVAQALFPPLAGAAAEARAFGDAPAAELYSFDGGTSQALVLTVRRWWWWCMWRAGIQHAT